MYYTPRYMKKNMEKLLIFNENDKDYKPFI
jgi:hypothetical protein